MKLTTVKITDLISPEYNPRDITPEDMDKLKTSITEFGYVDPIIVNDVNNHIVGGNQRYEALLELGFEDVEVSFIHEPDLNREKALNIALNKISGDWDFGKLTEILDDLELNGFDITLTGFEGLDDIDIDLDGDYDVNYDDSDDLLEEDDFTVGDDIEVTVKTGDVYELGNHRLMCGDSTKIDDLNQLMNGEKADMVFTDPPYGMFLDTDNTGMVGFAAGNKYKAVQGDSSDFSKELITTIFNNFEYCKEIFTWGCDYYAELIPNRNDGSWVVWDKQNKGEGVNDNYDKMFGSNFELCFSKNKHKRAIARVLWKGFFGLQNEDTRKRVHPTQKPLALVDWFTSKFSDEGDLIVDLYGGSGSTLISCEQTDRRCYMMEIDPMYCQVIINRWEDLTGETAVKLEE